MTVCLVSDLKSEWDLCTMEEVVTANEMTSTEPPSTFGFISDEEYIFIQVADYSLFKSLV